MAAKDLGPLDWRTPIVDSSGRPSPEFQRRWNTQRGNNGQIGFVTVSDGPPPGTPQDGEEYFDSSSSPWRDFVAGNGTWMPVGVQDFTDLSDVPGNYTSAAHALLRVNGNATGVEFGNLTTVLDGISTTEGAVLYRGNVTWSALAPSTAGFVMSTNGPGAAPSWVAQSGGGGGGGSTSPLVNGDIPAGIMVDPSGQTIAVPLGSSNAASNILTYLQAGLDADRPVSLNTAAGASAIWLSTDTGLAYIWGSGTWTAF